MEYDEFMGILVEKDISKYTFEELKAKLEKYESIGTPEDCAKWKKIHEDMLKGIKILQKPLDFPDEMDVSGFYPMLPPGTETKNADNLSELEKYKSLGTPEELKKAGEQAKEGEDLRKRLEAAKKAIETYEELPDDKKYTPKTDEEIKKMFGLE